MITLLRRLWRVIRPQPKPPVFCPRCQRAPATTWSGKRKVCLICAYEEIS